MRERAAMARNESSWHELAAASRSCSGFAYPAAPRNAGSLLGTSSQSAGGTATRWVRS